MRLSELARQIDTDVVRVIRDCGVTSAELCARISGDRAVTFLEKEKFLYCLDTPGISAVLCTEEMLPKIPPHIEGVVVTDAPKYAFYRIHNYFVSQRPRVQRPTVIGANPQISETAYVAPYNVVIGDNVVIEPGAIIQENVAIGNDVVICAGTAVGIRSFSPARYRDRAVVLRDCGHTVIGNHVEICAQCGIAQGILADDVTELCDYVKLDNMIHVGHGTKIGARTFIAAGAQLSGNVVIGEDVWIGVTATISNRIRIGDRARISLGAVVTKDVPEGQTVSGNFAIDHQTFLRNLKNSL